jgi:hypothetical protein
VAARLGRAQAQLHEAPRRGNRLRKLPISPTTERLKDRQQFLSLACQLIFKSFGLNLIGGSSDEARALKPHQSLSQHTGGDLFAGREELTEPLLSDKHVSHDDQGPPITDNI